MEIGMTDVGFRRENDFQPDEKIQADPFFTPNRNCEEKFQAKFEI